MSPKIFCLLIVPFFVLATRLERLTTFYSISEKLFKARSRDQDGLVSTRLRESGRSGDV